MKYQYNILKQFITNEDAFGGIINKQYKYNLSNNLIRYSTITSNSSSIDSFILIVIAQITYIFNILFYILSNDDTHLTSHKSPFVHNAIIIWQSSQSVRGRNFLRKIYVPGVLFTFSFTDRADAVVHSFFAEQKIEKYKKVR